MSLLPLKEAAAQIGVPYRTVLHYYKLGRLPTQPIGRYKVIDPAVLKAFLQAHHYRPRQK